MNFVDAQKYNKYFRAFLFSRQIPAARNARKFPLLQYMNMFVILLTRFISGRGYCNAIACPSVHFISCEHKTNWSSLNLAHTRCMLLSWKTNISRSGVKLKGQGHNGSKKSSELCWLSCVRILSNYSIWLFQAVNNLYVRHEYDSGTQIIFWTLYSQHPLMELDKTEDVNNLSV